MPDVLFSHGPCTGKHEHFSDSAVADGRVACGGVNYKVYPLGNDEYLALPPSYPAPSNIAATAPKAAPAWRRLVHGLVTILPADVRRSQAQRQRIRALARR